ncbi:hypothetical protein GCM10029964_054140 [Kibdelosporangium lantanae]
MIASAHENLSGSRTPFTYTAHSTTPMVVRSPAVIQASAGRCDRCRVVLAGRIHGIRGGFHRGRSFRLLSTCLAASGSVTYPWLVIA